MDSDSIIAGIASQTNEMQPPMQAGDMADAPQTVASKAAHGTSQLSNNDSTMSLAKITTSLTNNDSSANLAKIATRPSQNSLAGSRKFTPIQPVFNDFATAHSQITSKISRAKLSEANATEPPLQKTELTLEHFDVKPARLDAAFPVKLPTTPPRAALRGVRNLSHQFGALGGASDSGQESFTIRNYGKVFSPRLSMVKDSPLLDIESSDGPSSLMVYPPSTPKSKVITFRVVRPTSSVYSVSSPSPVPKTNSQDPGSGILPPAQAAGNDGSSSIIEQTKYQPGLFHSTSETVIHNHNYGDILGMDIADFGNSPGPYYGYNEDISFKGSNNGEDLILFPDHVLDFEDRDQNSVSNPSTTSVTNSSPHSESGTVLHHVELIGLDDDNISLMSFLEEGDSIESITLPDNIPTATRATHGCPMVCPSQESIRPSPFTPYRHGTNTAAPATVNTSNIGLPRVPAPPGRVYLADSSPKVLGPSSSPYGDTRDLLDLSPNTPTKKNVGKQGNGASPLKVSLNADDDKSMSPATHARHERNISNQLHGMTDAGTTDKSPSPKKGELVVQLTPSSFRSVMKNLRSDQKRLSKLFSDGFYANNLSPSKRHRRNKPVKIPIRPIVPKDGSPKRSKDRTSGSSAITITGKEADANDWETIADSIARFSNGDKDSIRPFVNAAFNEAGSSIANFSDRLGESSSGPILAAITLAASEQAIRFRNRFNDEYGMHPGNAMETSSSAMLPVRRLHGTDGFPLNGFRTPKRGFGTVPSSLMPEQTMSSPLDAYSRSRQNGPVSKPQYKTQFNDHFQQDESISTTMDMTLPGHGNYAGPSTPNTWVKGANHVEVDLGGPSNQRMGTPDSFMQMIIQANGGKMPQYMGDNDNDSQTRTLGSSVADTSTASDDSFVDMHGPAMNANHPYGGLYAFNGQGPSAKERSGITPGNARTRTPLVKGPPGAFYRKLRSKANSLRAKKVDETPTKKPFSPSKSLGLSMPGKTGASHSPSRMLRPLSLVAETLGPINQDIPQPAAAEDYIYRSPLAPVQSAEWMNLYSTADLNRINNSPPSSAHSSPRLIEEPLLGAPRSPTWAVHEGPPRLTAWIHDNSSSATNTAARKTMISNVAVAVCLFFPPALLLLRFGWLDQFMIWYTKGDISHFGKTQKKIAGYLFAAYVGGATVAVIVTVLLQALHAASAHATH
ncbi:hypothetical protein O988_06063 [Pseudogymnoascus sp. VKM F-3808]|nr:hypothetical protein O988_06063 [Pseudogymnoascus sp. VKM F-3808]